MSIVFKDAQTTLVDAFSAFWREQFRVETVRDGLVVAMPLMDSAGWQVELYLRPVTPTQWMLSDAGKTLGLLDDAGKNLNATATRETIEAQARFYGFERNGLILQKAVRFPFDPVEIQVFADGLVALTHLAPKRQVSVSKSAAYRMEERIGNYFYRHHWEPIRHHKLAGKVESEIVVDYYLERKRPLALQPIGRSHQLRPYMEQWAWRWTDLKSAHPDLLRAMVFDPDAQAWDSVSRRIGEMVCDIFVPYYEADEALDDALVA